MIPQNINDCTKKSSTSTALYKSAETLRKSRTAVISLCLILGIVMAVSAGIEMDEIDSDYTVMAVISAFLPWVIYAVLIGAVINCVALLLEALGAIVHQTGITANVSLFTAAQQASSTIIEPQIMPDSAESEKQADSAAERVVVKVSDGGMITCPACSTKQRSNRSVCFRCGVRFEKE